MKVHKVKLKERRSSEESDGEVLSVKSKPNYQTT